MTLEEIESEERFISMMKGILSDEMTQELAQQEANADHRTEQQGITWHEFSGNFN